MSGKAKEILSSDETEMNDQAINHHSPQKGLSRTRSSQYLNDNREDHKGSSGGSNKIDEYKLQDNESEKLSDKDENELDSAQRKKIKEGLYPDSEEETMDINQSIVKRQTPPIDITRSNFFTDNFDHSKAEDVISQIQNKGLDGSMENPDSN